MNKRTQGFFERITILAGLAAALSLAAPATQAAAAPGGRSTGAAQAGSSEFFIISSVEARKGEMVLKMPTEVTLTMGVNDKTVILGEQSQHLKVSDLVSGDTAYISYKRTAQGVVAEKIQLAPMTVEELHRRYLNGESVPVPKPAPPPAKTAPPRKSTPHPQGTRLQRGA